MKRARVGAGLLMPRGRKAEGFGRSQPQRRVAHCTVVRPTVPSPHPRAHSYAARSQMRIHWQHRQHRQRDRALGRQHKLDCGSWAVKRAVSGVRAGTVHGIVHSVTLSTIWCCLRPCILSGSRAREVQRRRIRSGEFGVINIRPLQFRLLTRRTPRRGSSLRHGHTRCLSRGDACGPGGGQRHLTLTRSIRRQRFPASRFLRLATRSAACGLVPAVRRGQTEGELPQLPRLGATRGTREGGATLFPPPDRVPLGGSESDSTRSLHVHRVLTCVRCCALLCVHYHRVCRTRSLAESARLLRGAAHQDDLQLRARNGTQVPRTQSFSISACMREDEVARMEHSAVQKCVALESRWTLDLCMLHPNFHPNFQSASVPPASSSSSALILSRHDCVSLNRASGRRWNTWIRSWMTLIQTRT